MMKKKLQINDLTYAFEQYQNDDSLPVLLMLHGFMGDSRVFDHLIDDLKKACNPITVDLLGHGKSAKPNKAEHYREEQQIDDLETIINQLGLAPLFLYGYSMGGRLALKIALEKPDLFTGLILESTTCGITDIEERDKRSFLDYERSEEIELDLESFLEEWKTLELFQSPLPVDKKMAQKYHTIQSEQSPKGLSGSLRGFGTGDMTPVCDKLKDLTKPVLLLAGSADEKYQHINTQMANEFPDATFQSVEAGHRVHLDNPSGLINQLANFINKNSTS